MINNLKIKYYTLEKFLLSLMQTLTQINKNLEVIKKLIKLNSKIFYYKNINYFPLIKLAMFSNTGLGNKKKEIKFSHQLSFFQTYLFF